MAEMLLAKYHDVIEAVPPDRSDQPLRESVLPDMWLSTYQQLD
jgi:hypothetical protein